MKLIFSQKEGLTKSFEIQEGNNLIGRWDTDASSFPEIDLEELDIDAKVSRKHALITKTGEKLILEDAGSLNGTYVIDPQTNQQIKLEAGSKHMLSAGDKFIIGKLLFTVSE